MTATHSQQQSIAAIEQALREGRLAEAESATSALVAEAPTLLEAWLLAARIHVQRARWNDAESAFTTLERLHPGHPGVALARGHLLVRLGRDTEAMSEFQRAAAGLGAGPAAGSEEARAMIAACERRLGRPERALELLAKLPPSPSGLNLMAQALLDLGQPGRAEALLRPVASRPMSPMGRSQLLHTLGRALEAQGRCDEALGMYVESKAALGVRFDPAMFNDMLGRMRRAFSRSALRALPRSTIRSERPVLIAAPPRSGTTLLERIIESHPQAAGAGETDAMRVQLAPLSPIDPYGAMLEVLPSWDSGDLDGMARRYLDDTTPFGPDALRIADKNLQNWTMLGLHSIVLPQARAIHIRRDPLDTGLSCFERLNPLAVPWAADLGQIGAMLRQAAELMEFWKENLEIPILTVDYEDLVRETRVQTQRILEFIGLPWSDSCLVHHLNPAESTDGERRRAPPTLGTEQASRPIYDSSIGRGARFGAALDPLREALAV
jgi:tetratricopeptide (TPR) repeat protein